MTESVWRIAKAEAVADHGMVAAKHPLAARIGREVLQRGGNAIDAAVTAAFVLGVIEPNSSGIGGGGFLVLHEAASGRDVVIDYAMDAPLAAGPDTYVLEEGVGSSVYGWRKVRAEANVAGWRSVALPGMVRGLALALERFGTIPWQDALAPAIRLAAEGVAVNPPLAFRSGLSFTLLRRFPATAAVFLPDGAPLRPRDGERPGDRLVQRDLARTLQRIAADGPDVFYAGEVAGHIARAMAREGGLITEADLARYQPTVSEGGMTAGYRDCRIVGVPGACGAVTALQGLAILEGYDLAALGQSTPATLHRQAEAFRLAFADRYRYVGDPKQVPVPWEGLLSREYAATRRRAIHPERAAAAVSPGDPWAHQPSRAASPVGSAPPLSDTSTTHLAVVDRHRNVVALTQTLVNNFGSGVVVPGTGILLNNAMSWFDPEPGRVNSLAPGRRGLNNMAPCIVLRGGQPLLVVGAAGGRKIMQAVAQVIMNVVDHGLSVQDAIAAPRIDCSGDAVLIDARLPEAVPRALEALGHRVRRGAQGFNTYAFAVPLGIRIDPLTNRLHGGVDPFQVGIAAGY